jgi:hypothetical protein
MTSETEFNTLLKAKIKASLARQAKDRAQREESFFLRDQVGPVGQVDGLEEQVDGLVEQVDGLLAQVAELERSVFGLGDDDA